MVNGITWEEETQARLRQAREKLKEASERCKQSEMEANHWRQYVDALEKVLELDKQQRGVKVDEQHTFDPERLLRQSVRKSLIDIASANKGLLVVVDAIPILINAGVFADREHARNSIYSNLYHYKKQFAKVHPGVYRFVGARQSLDAHRLAMLGINEEQRQSRLPMHR